MGDDELTRVTFAFGVGGDVGKIFGEFVDGATVDSVEIEAERSAGGANATNPFQGLFLDALGLMAFVVGDIDADASQFSIAFSKSSGNDLLEGAEIIGVSTDEK